jgi:small subunit ribosomal protein S18
MIRKPRFIRRKLPTNVTFTYKQPEILVQFVTEQGMILPREVTNLSQKIQKRLATEIKRARHLALLPFTQTLR